METELVVRSVEAMNTLGGIDMPTYVTVRASGGRDHYTRLPGALKIEMVMEADMAPRVNDIITVSVTVKA